MQEVKGVTYSVEHYEKFAETGDLNYFEEIIDMMILDGISGMNDTFRNAIRGLSRDKKRMTILSLLDKDLNLFKRIKALTDKNINKMDHIKDIIMMLREYVKVGEVEKKKFGEVMTPLELVKEMLATLPEEVWSNPNLKWLDPANGTGPYPIMVIFKLMKGLKDCPGLEDDEVRYKHIVENMIYVCELQPKNMFLYMCAVDPFDTYKLNIYTGSFLEGEFDKHMKDVWGVEKFDICLGNPPYQEVDDNLKRKPGGTNLYMKFIKKSIDFSNYLLFITPLSWMAPGNERSVNKFFFRDYFLKNTILYLESGSSQKYFNGVGSKFSYFLLKKGKEKCITKLDTNINNNRVRTEMDLETIDNLFFLPILPNKHCLDIFNKVIFSTKEKLEFKLDLEYDIRRNPDIREINDEYKYKVYNTGTQVRYSNFKTKSFDKKKVIISGSGNLNPFYNDGDCSTANNTLYMFVNSKEEGESIVNLLKSNLFKFILNYSKYSGFFTKEVFWALPKINSYVKNDDDVYKHFQLTLDEISLVESLVK